MPESAYSTAKLTRDLSAGLVVFLVALPLCLGIAMASRVTGPDAPESNVPLMAGMLAGIVGGIVVGLLSGSHTSVSGPSAGSIAIVSSQLLVLGSFEALLYALFVAGCIQMALGLFRVGVLSAFFPSSVIKGLLAAIGLLLILKQIPHLVGHDTDPYGEMSFDQPDERNTFSEFIAMAYDLHPGAAIIGVLSLIVLAAWEKNQRLKNSNLPAPLVVVVLGVGLHLLFDWLGGSLEIERNHLVGVSVANNLAEFASFLTMADFTQWNNPAAYTAGFSIAMVSSLETLLNLNAADKLDAQQRVSPPNRELFVQGIGNMVLSLIGGIPATSVVVRSSVNINAGAKTKFSAIFHGILLLVCMLLLPRYLNMIPLSCLAAILFVTGLKLTSPAVVARMWSEGRYQFAPFMITLFAIVFTDLLKGVLIGLAVSVIFILASNLRRPLRRIVEKHLGGEVLHIQLASQVSFLNRATLERTLREVPRGGHVLLDASNTEYIDPDVLDLIRDFKETIAPAHGVQLSVRGFRDRYQLKDEIQFVDYSTRELQDLLTSDQVLQILKDGNERFRTGQRLTRDFGRQLDATAKGQHPLAVVLSCIDSRTPSEIIFDLGLGDIFSVRVAGNVIGPSVLASMEYGCAVAGAKLILVIGHTSCGAVTAAVDLVCSGADPAQATGCQHLEHIVSRIQKSVASPTCERVKSETGAKKAEIVNDVARQNVLRTVKEITEDSDTIRKLVMNRRIAVLGALYDVASGRIDFLTDNELAGRVTPSVLPTAPVKTVPHQ